MADALVLQDTTYAGEAASEFIVLSVINSDTIQSGVAYVKDGIKKEFTIPRLDVEDIIQDRVDTPTSDNSAGTLTVSARTLNPGDFMVYLEFNPRQFEDHWFAAQMNPELLDAALPKT